MNTLMIKGNITSIFETETISSKDGKTWKKQNFIINTGAQYNSEICFQLFGEERIEILKKFKLNDHVDVYFNLYSKKFNDRYFHNIDAWKIEKSDKETNNDIDGENNPF